jgi:hypothetical protein
MYGFVSEGAPFQVFARREGDGSSALVFRFECSEGMGVLGLRKVGRPDPPPSPAYEEQDIEPASLRAGRFVHVLPSGQRQSYALSRLGEDTAARLPHDRWVSLEPQTEYGFRYLVAPPDQLEADRGTTAQIVVGSGPSTSETAPTNPPGAGSPAGAPQRNASSVPGGAQRSAAPGSVPPAAQRSSAPPGNAASLAPGSIPPQTPMIPALAASALAKLTRDQAIDHLKGEMAKVSALQRHTADLEDQLRRATSRERDLIELLARWQQAS